MNLVELVLKKQRNVRVETWDPVSRSWQVEANAQLSENADING